jgi:hypothetical protein
MKRSQHITTAGLPLGTALFFLTFGASLASPASPTKVSPGTASTAKANPDAPKTAEPASSDSTTLRGGEGGTKFPDMTVTGEDRIRIESEQISRHEKWDVIAIHPTVNSALANL